MLKTLEIENFRPFKNLKLRDLRRVNVITGPNASGKTALIEACLLGVKALPVAIAQINQQRGLLQSNLNAGLLPMMAPIITPVQFRAQWDNLFYRNDPDQIISIRYTDTARVKHQLRMRYAGPVGREAAAMGSTGFAAVVPFLMERTRGKSELKKITISLSPQGQFSADAVTEPLGPASAFFSSGSLFSESDNTFWFSTLSAANRENEVLALVQEEFPDIKGLSILAPAGAQSLFAETGNRKLPMTLISSGVTKFVTLVLASLVFKDGVILCDEIENGVFHARYKNMWRVLCKLARDQGNQLFISTHSLECLKALGPAMKGNEEDFCLLRTRTENGEVVVRHVAGRAMAAAISGGSEIR